MDEKPREADIDSEDGLEDDESIGDVAMLRTKQNKSSGCIFFIGGMMRDATSEEELLFMERILRIVALRLSSII